MAKQSGIKIGEVYVTPRGYRKLVIEIHHVTDTYSRVRLENLDGKTKGIRQWESLEWFRDFSGVTLAEEAQ